MTNDERAELDELHRKASGHIKHWEFNKAIETFKYILNRYANDPQANEYTNARLGDVLLTMGQFDLAERHIRKAISYDPDNPFYHHLLGFVYFTRYDFKNQIEEYKLALKHDPHNCDYLCSLAFGIFNSGDKMSGLEHLHELEPLYPNDPGLMAQMATALLSAGDIRNARLYAEKAVAQRREYDIYSSAVLRKVNELEKGIDAAPTN